MVSDLLNKTTSALEHAKGHALAEIVGYLKRESPLYERKFAGVDPRDIRSLQDISRLPFTTRDDLTRNAPFGALCRNARPQALYQSTGTTGEPVPGFPDLSAEKAESFGKFLDRWMGLRQARVRVALVSLAYEMNPTGIRFQMALPHAGVMVLPVGVRTTICSPASVLRIIGQRRPQAIFSRPFEILRQGDALLAEGGSPADTDVTKLFFLGEIVSPAKWRRMETLWDGAEIFGHYGLTEIDSGLQTCSFGRYHEPESPFLHTEILDVANQEPLPDQSWGEFVFSVLRKSHAPLVRYRTGDIGRRLPGRCPCGSPIPSYQIRGRALDAHAIDGKIVFPVEIEDAVLGNDAVGNEYLFVIRPDGRLHLLLERAFSSGSDCAAIASDVRASVYDRFDIDVSVEVRPFGGLADKLGVPKKKSGRFTDLRGLSAPQVRSELLINVLDSHHLQVGQGEALSI
jgi:phenylacetate-coenzyme A ligase PaaK-like adenylate-forming protein